MKLNKNICALHISPTGQSQANTLGASGNTPDASYFRHSFHSHVENKRRHLNRDNLD